MALWKSNGSGKANKGLKAFVLMYRALAVIDQQLAVMKREHPSICNVSIRDNGKAKAMIYLALEMNRKKVTWQL